MTADDRQQIRFAIWIHDQLSSRRPSRMLPHCSINGWSRVTRLHRLLAEASQKGWQVAAEILRRRLAAAIRDARQELNDVEHGLEDERRTVLSSGEILAEMRALGSELGSVQFDLPNKEIRVTTEPIELDGQYLGPFSIELSFLRGRGNEPGRYRVIACDPQPAACNSEVTHPHVSGEVLCEGEGYASIRRCLGSGRLFDFFVIVLNILRTYNAGSAYVSIEQWQGVSCHGCGDTLSEDEGVRCTRCEAQSCGECSTYCSICESDYCQECTVRCPGCNDWYCAGCLTPCENCSTELCTQCLNDQSLCGECHEKKAEEESGALAEQATARSR
jgi:hypothetical protein